jgi:ribose 5-phosphate isomerase B
MSRRAPSGTVAVASDHAGFPLKDWIARELAESGRQVLDLGTNGADSVDYPDFGHAMARAILDGEADCGVLVCGTGIGIGIAANRHKGIRAAVCHSAEVAALARAHNDANILVLGGRVIDDETASACLRSFLETEFEGGRHQRRIDMLD